MFPVNTRAGRERNPAQHNLACVGSNEPDTGQFILVIFKYTTLGKCFLVTVIKIKLKGGYIKTLLQSTCNFSKNGF